VKRKHRKWQWLWDALLIGVMLGFVMFADRAIGAPLHLSLGVFCLFPVMIATRRLGVEVGVSTALVATAVLFAEQSWQSPSPSIVPAWNVIVNGVFLTTIAALQGRWRKVQTRLEAAASEDPLTGIANRRAFRGAADIELRRMARTKQPLSVVHIDLDNFKGLNDAHGHAEGDKVLTVVAQLLAAGRLTDTAARTGGDEFVILLPDTDSKQARIMVDRLRERIADVMHANSLWQNVTCSVGIATFLRAPEDPATLIAAADESMYDVKRGSKNGVRQVLIDGDHKTDLHKVA